MKSKSLTYILLLVVAVIWYQVFFRVKSSFWDEEELPPGLETRIPKPVQLKRDTFAILANYRDPFTGGVSNTAVTSTTTMPDLPKTLVEKPKALPERWPTITYYGQIKKQSSKNPLALLTIDGMQFNLRKGEHVFDDYMVKEIYRDSVIIVHKKIKRSFKKTR